MEKSLIKKIHDLFLSNKSHTLSLDKILEELVDNYPEMETLKLKHAIRRAIQSLNKKETIKRIKQGVYSLNDGSH